MNIRLLRELETYIEEHKAEEHGLMREGSCFRQQPLASHFLLIKNKEKVEKEHRPEPDFSAFRKEKPKPESREKESCSVSEEQAPQVGKGPKEQDLEEYIRKQKSKETFSTKLLQFIDQTGLSDAEIYKRAGIDRRHFSKIRCDRDYRPKKATVLALCLALELDESKTVELLNLAGYSLSNGDTADLVVRFCIQRGIYDLLEVNEALDYFGQKAIGVTQ